MSVEFRVLGAVEAVVDGQPVPVAGNRERAVLARLLASPNQVVAQDTLIDDLGLGEAPDGGAGAIQVYVSRLRKALRGAGPDGEGVLLTRPPGYLLAVDPDAVDATRFEVLVRRARAAAAEGDHAGAATTLAGALALWRGPAYPGLTDLAFARAEATRLEEARLGALEARIEADLACGRDVDLIGELVSLTGEHPLREGLWALRMTALYRAGRQAEALRTYQELRRHLGEELGIEPSEGLRALEGAILRQDAGLARPGPAARPPSPGDAPRVPAQGVAASAGELAETPGPGVVTFMFTDIVGSTELLDRLGDDAADELRRRHFSTLRQALRTHGGAEVKSLGDGLMAAFTSPAAALRCAVKIQQENAVATSAASSSAGGYEAVAVRVGIHAGEPIREDDDFFGTPVVVAQRLCGKAEGGQILVSALVSGLVGNRAGCSFTPLGALALKGFGEPVAVCDVRWAPPEPAPILPLPGVLARQDSFFIRPEAEMARLEAAWAAARSGRRQLVLLAGEPGIGKTRRSAEIARTAHEAGAVVLHGRCDDGLSVPYQPFVEALGTYLRQAPGPRPALGRLAGELVRLVPELGDRFPDLPLPLAADPDTERYRLFDAVAAWLAAVAEETPAVLVIDDIHWATPPTLAMLVHLVRSGEPGRLLVVANYRDTALDVTPALEDAVADLLRQADVDRVRLGGLDRAGVAAYLQARAGHDLDSEGHEFAGVLHAETAGNPFYLNEVLRDLGESGALTRRDGRWAPSPGPAGGLDVPDSVRDVIARRLTRLPDETGEILALAAVQGDHFDLSVLVEAAGRPYLSVVSALDPAVTARLVTEAEGSPPRHRFVHALVRHTVEDGLPTARRLQLHRATGEAVATLAGDAWPDHAPALARHWLAATPPVAATKEDLLRTLGYADVAARRAAAALAYEEAADLLTRALPLADQLDDPARRAALLVALGEAQHNAGDAAHRRTLADAAERALELGDGSLAARAALANFRIVLTLDVDPEREGLLERVLHALGPDDTAARARVLAALAVELHYPADPRSHDVARQAVAVARRLDDPACLGMVLSLACFCFWQMDTLTERLALAIELFELAKRLSDPVLEVEAGVALYYAAVAHGDIHQGREALAVATRAAEEIGQPAPRLRAVVAQQSCAMLDGRFSDYTRFAAEANHLGEALGNTDRAINYHADTGTLCLLQGRVDEAFEGLSAVVENLPPIWSAFLVWPHAEAGRLSEAAAIVASIGGSTLRDVPGGFVRLLTLAFLAPACGLLGDRALARRLYDELLPHREEIALGQVSNIGPVAHYLGLLAAVLDHPEDADEHFAFAAERTGARGILVRTRLEWARLLLTRDGPGDGERARDLATTALDLAGELDSPDLARQASALLADGEGSAASMTEGA